MIYSINIRFNVTQARLVIPYMYSKFLASLGTQDFAIDTDGSTTFTFQKNNVPQIPLIRKLGNIDQRIFVNLRGKSDCLLQITF